MEHATVASIKLTKSLAVAAVVTLGASLGIAPAGADGFPGGSMRLADNEQHTFCFPTGAGEVPAGNRARYTDAMQFLDATTDLYDTPVSCGNLTDVLFREINLPGPRGQYQCLDLNESNRCESSRVDVDIAQLFSDTAVWYPGGGQAFADNFAINVAKTSRHEVGHSVGLNNDGVSFVDANSWFAAGLGDIRGCTVSGWVPTDLIWARYSPHHIGHINAAY